MNAWKSSTLLVLAAFTVSVVLLFAKAGMHSERSHGDRVVVSNHIYSPAAADPQLRNPERAERLRRAAKPIPASATNVRPQHNRATATPARQLAPTRDEAPRTQTESTPTPSVAPSASSHVVPEGHVYYVVMATFSSRDNAERGLVQMKAKGLDKSFVGTFDEGKFYSVIGNTFSKESAARYMINELKEKHGISAYIYHKRD